MEAWVFDDEFLAKAQAHERAKKMAAQKTQSFPGFIKLSNQVFLRDAPLQEKPSNTAANDKHPNTVIIFGWGDGLARHLVKYADGYQTLYPSAKQIVVLSPISRAMGAELPSRTYDMLPVIQAAFVNPPSAGQHQENSPISSETPRILVHIMSNTGAVNYAAALNAYKKLYNRCMPHTMLVLDSTPGSVVVTASNMRRWSRAIALGTADWFPWPFAVTQTIMGAGLAMSLSYSWLRGTDAAAAWSLKATQNTEYVDTATRRVFLYSKEDQLIGWEDIEKYASWSEENGWDVDRVVFEGSDHVGHMRRHPEQYWTAVRTSWDQATSS